jgi:hypothetical protein
VKRSKFLLSTMLVCLLLLHSISYSQVSQTLQSAASSGNGTAITVTGYSAVTLSIIGSAGSDRVVTFQGSQDGTNYASVMCYNLTTTTQSTTLTTSGTTLFQFRCSVAGFRLFRTPLSAGTTGTVTINALALANVSASLWLPGGLGSLTGVPVGDGSGNYTGHNPLNVANGGSGATSLIAHAILLGNSTSAIQAIVCTGTTSIWQGGSPGSCTGTPMIETSVTTPLIVGGTGTTSPLTLRSTSGVGATGADIIFQVGNNGATEAMRILNSGNVGIGTAASEAKLDITANANAIAVRSTGYSVTGSGTTALVDLAGTWNTVGTPTAILLNITDTASHGNSLLFDVQTGGTSRFRVKKNGEISLNAGSFFGTPGVSLPDGGVIGLAGRASLTFNSGGTSPRTAWTANASANTSASTTLATYTWTISPPSGSGSAAMIHLNPTINGTSSGIAYGLGIASVTNTLTGGTIKLLSIGTTTTDLFTGYTELFGIGNTGNVGIGTTSPGGSGTVGTAILSFANGTAPVGGVANQVSIYSADVAASAELFALDEAGNTPQLSPHPSDFLATLPVEGREYPWAHSSSNAYLGKKVQVDFAGLIKAIETLTLQKFMFVTNIPKEDWDTHQELRRLQIEQQREKAQAEIATFDEQIAAETSEEKKAQLTKQRDAIVVRPPYVKKRPPQWLVDRGVRTTIQ